MTILSSFVPKIAETHVVHVDGNTLFRVDTRVGSARVTKVPLADERVKVTWVQGHVKASSFIKKQREFFSK